MVIPLKRVVGVALRQMQEQRCRPWLVLDGCQVAGDAIAECDGLAVVVPLSVLGLTPVCSPVLAGL